MSERLVYGDGAKEIRGLCQSTTTLHEAPVVSLLPALSLRDWAWGEKPVVVTWGEGEPGFGWPGSEVG